jgi:hypothetical protein
VKKETGKYYTGEVTSSIKINNNAIQNPKLLANSYNTYILTIIGSMFLLRFSLNTLIFTRSLQDLHTTTHIHITHSGSPPIQHFYFINITKTTDIKNKNKNIQTRTAELCNEWACDTTAPID